MYIHKYSFYINIHSHKHSVYCTHSLISRIALLPNLCSPAFKAKCLISINANLLTSFRNVRTSPKVAVKKLLLNIIIRKAVGTSGLSVANWQAPLVVSYKDVSTETKSQS